MCKPPAADSSRPAYPHTSTFLSPPAGAEVKPRHATPATIPQHIKPHLQAPLALGRGSTLGWGAKMTLEFLGRKAGSRT
ncbi:hypothetical protein E2C01_090813 [Portunus trituberculatus]|uniref:Uncharacterized protein n=1 Tax=Portunus trituberculatus TaxID=210409 RepID=A0A5B7JLW6_PORTR|nr:hypothetical protein [Portunus trituberculatus]